MESNINLMDHKSKHDSIEDVLVHFATSLMKKNTIDDVLWDLAGNCISKLDFVDCVIYSADYDKQILIQRAAYGPKSPKTYEVIERIDIPFGSGITGNVVISGQSELISDTSKDPRYLVDDESRLSEISVPILINNNVWGVIDCENPNKDYFSDRHLRILQAVAAICAVKIERLQVEEELTKKQHDLMLKEKELLELRISSLRRQVNPHFLFNALNAIQYFITTDQKKDALKYYTKFSKLLRKYMLHLEEEFLVLEEEIRMLEWYLKLQQARYSDRFTFEVTTESSLLMVRVNTYLFQMITEDMVESMIMSSNGTGHLNVHFSETKDRLCAELKFQIEGDMIKRKKEDYRSDLLHYKDHIDVLNKLKDYQIHVVELENWQNKNSYTRTIIVKMPLNL